MLVRIALMSFAKDARVIFERFRIIYTVFATPLHFESRRMPAGQVLVVALVRHPKTK